jgi:hypothetical protein
VCQIASQLSAYFSPATLFNSATKLRGFAPIGILEGWNTGIMGCEEQKD